MELQKLKICAILNNQWYQEVTNFLAIWLRIAYG